MWQITLFNWLGMIVIFSLFSVTVACCWWWLGNKFWIMNDNLFLLRKFAFKKQLKLFKEFVRENEKERKKNDWKL